MHNLLYCKLFLGLRIVFYISILALYSDVASILLVLPSVDCNEDHYIGPQWLSRDESTHLHPKLCFVMCCAIYLSICSTLKPWVNIRSSIDVLKTSGAPLGVEENAVTITCSVIGNIAPDSWSWQDANSTDSSQVSFPHQPLLGY